MKLLVCGGRLFADYIRVGPGYMREQWLAERDVVYNAIADALGWVSTADMQTWLPPTGTTIICGGARGVDSMAVDWAVVHWCNYIECKPDWGKYGKAAGVLRNQHMLDTYHPDKVLAIHGGRGTQDMVARAQAAGVPVMQVGMSPPNPISFGVV